MKSFVQAITFFTIIFLFGGCDRMVQDVGMDRDRFIAKFFGSAFPADRLALEFVYKAGVRGYAAVARVSGSQEEIKRLLESKGVNELRREEGRDDVSKLVQLRVTGLAKEKANVLLLPEQAGAEYMWQTRSSTKGTVEYYVAIDYSHFIFVELRR